MFKSICYIGLCLCMIHSAWADSSADLFTWDETELSTSLADLTAFDTFLESHASASLAELRLSHPEATATFLAMDPLFENTGYRLFGVPSWAWGAVFGFCGGISAIACPPLGLITLIGVGAVAIDTYDKPEFKNELIVSGAGCAVGTIVGVGVYVVGVVALSLGTAGL